MSVGECVIEQSRASGFAGLDAFRQPEDHVDWLREGNALEGALAVGAWAEGWIPLECKNRRELQPRRTVLHEKDTKGKCQICLPH